MKYEKGFVPLSHTKTCSKKVICSEGWIGYKFTVAPPAGDNYRNTPMQEEFRLLGGFVGHYLVAKRWMNRNLPNFPQHGVCGTLSRCTENEIFLAEDSCSTYKYTIVLL